jgi:hypothetical protein
MYSMLRFHSEEKSVEPLDTIGRILKSASTLAPWTRTARGLADADSETAVILFRHISAHSSHWKLIHATR